MTKRPIATIGIAGFCAVVALASCRVSVPRALPSGEVLQRSILRNATAERISFDALVTGSIGTTLSGSLVVVGTLTRGGERLKADVSFFIERSRPEGLRNIRGKAMVVAAPGSPPLLRFDELSGMLADAWASTVSGSLLGRWWRLPEGMIIASARTSLDPEAMERLYKSIRVTDDHGIERARGAYLYRYDIIVGAESPEAEGLRGTLWIDARTFALRRAQWTFTFATFLGDASLVLDTEFSDEPTDTEQPIIGDGEAQELPLLGIFDIISRNR